jgi:hypothetical protein
VFIHDRHMIPLLFPFTLWPRREIIVWNGDATGIRRGDAYTSDIYRPSLRVTRTYGLYVQIIVIPIIHERCPIVAIGRYDPHAFERFEPVSPSLTIGGKLKRFVEPNSDLCLLGCKFGFWFCIPVKLDFLGHF